MMALEKSMCENSGLLFFIEWSGMNGEGDNVAGV